jgi:hypothetical protein
MAQVKSKQLFNPISGSFTGSFSGSFSGDGSGLFNVDVAKIDIGSITASVSSDINNLFLIKSGSTSYFNISASGDAAIFSNLFIVKNFTTRQAVLTVSQSVVQIATHSADPTGTTPAGAIWFTSSSFYVGLE